MAGYWRCPHCQAVRQKSARLRSYDRLREAQASFSVMNAPGNATCLACGKALDYRALMSGDYDFSNVTGPSDRASLLAFGLACLVGLVAARLVFGRVGGGEPGMSAWIAAIASFAAGVILGFGAFLLATTSTTEPALGAPPEQDVARS